MKERLLEFLKNENKSSSQLAEEIGVQASGISHILSGRNNPSLDFILKMLEKYKFLSTEWLLFGKGPMYKEAREQNLFDYEVTEKLDNERIMDRSKQIRNDAEFHDVIEKSDNTLRQSDHNMTSDVIKIVWFYENNSFEEFFPKK
jgi:transcriptional regulator with XRE-family HTH domain